MPVDYPWYAPPERERIVVRLRPGENLADGAVLEWEGESFSAARPAGPDERRLVSDDPMIFATPGLFDVQINGYLGRGFKDTALGPEGIRDLCWSILLSGTVRFLPTVTTDAPEIMQTAMANIDAACRAYPEVAAMVAGIHQEGPWISPLNGPRGAHPLQYVVSPDLDSFDSFQAASRSRIRLLTIAPEIEGMIDFIRQVSRRGIVVSLGHHQADRETIRRAVQAGARKVTHLGNGCQIMMPRHPNVLWSQAAEDRLYAGIISDGHHLPPETVKVFCRAKPPDRLILVSDAVSMAGAPPGLYHMPDAVAELSPAGRFGFYGTTTLIGAAVPLSRCLANFARFVEELKTPVDYLDRVTTVPGTLLGVSGAAAPLGQPGTAATFVVWRWVPETPELIPQRIVMRGRTVYDVETMPIQVPFGRTTRPATQEEAERWLASQQRISA
jgi:N-acetylglucosamine-6-phosphate deacetylase